ncbi:uncharacterized protein J8A68_004583 [[Candida] subhashii]|uniref:Uncharacterized protein n=1 Tax=[Candida] subhashii TaxID=561895 RepID=A0A8J5QGZ2_9ASCO|nr:uncharacterized protein J8A68_004583 [[Candida] subhashii]KAG7661888.1 hypothetical protein J8A68_004583 [[Candida] subhashii]
MGSPRFLSGSLVGVYQANAERACSSTATFNTTLPTYAEATEALRLLDTLPCLRFKFPDVLRTLTTTGALSHPQNVPSLKALFDTTKHDYFKFLAFLDVDWWNLGPNLPDKSSQRPSRTSHYIQMDYPF